MSDMCHQLDRHPRTQICKCPGLPDTVLGGGVQMTPRTEEAWAGQCWRLCPEAALALQDTFGTHVRYAHPTHQRCVTCQTRVSHTRDANVTCRKCTYHMPEKHHMPETHPSHARHVCHIARDIHVTGLTHHMPETHATHQTCVSHARDTCVTCRRCICHMP